MSLRELQTTIIAIAKSLNWKEVQISERKNKLIEQTKKFRCIFNALPPRDRKTVRKDFNQWLRIYYKADTLIRFLGGVDANSLVGEGGGVAYFKDDAKAHLDLISKYQESVKDGKIPPQGTPLQACLHFPQFVELYRKKFPNIDYIYNSTFIDEHEEAAILNVLFNIADNFPRIHSGKEIWSEVSEQLKKSTTPVLITELKRMSIDKKKLKWAGCSHTFKIGINVIFIRDFILTANKSEFPKLGGVLQNELFECAWREKYGEDFVQHWKLQTANALVSKRFSRLLGRRTLAEKDLLEIFNRVRVSYKDSDTGKFSGDSPEFILLIDRLSAFASDGKYLTFEFLKDAAEPSIGKGGVKGK